MAWSVKLTLTQHLLTWAWLFLSQTLKFEGIQLIKEKIHHKPKQTDTLLFLEPSATRIKG